MTKYKSKESVENVMLEYGWLTVKEASRRACVADSTIRDLISRREIRSITNGSRRFVFAVSLAEYYSAPPIVKRIMDGVHAIDNEEH